MTIAPFDDRLGRRENTFLKLKLSREDACMAIAMKAKEDMRNALHTWSRVVNLERLRQRRSQMLKSRIATLSAVIKVHYRNATREHVYAFF